jgi:hypothetical protein
VVFARHLLQLQGWRTRADYDHLVRVGRPLALLACRAAREAIAALEALRERPTWTTFGALMLHRGLW